MNDTSQTPQAPPAAFPASAPPPPPPVAFGPAAPAQATLPPGVKNPGAAGILGIIPGLGHLYLGLMQRGAVLFGVWVLLITVASHGQARGPFPGILIPFWMIFSIIDAVQQAKAINATGSPVPGILGEDRPVKVNGSLTAGILLVLVGGFLLLSNFVTIDLSFLVDWWPALLVLFGAWQIFSYWKGKQDETKNEAG
ncbi:MAG TPA: DUF5668 domain-containing protein [Thermoanaerobaculia bacterium]|nr:DUF5668 domain-containing protein [Thermoanaerobaculia bacterium]